MGLQQILFGLTELLAAVAVSLILVFGTYRLLLRLTRRVDEENELRKGNVAVGILLGSVILGQAVVVRQALGPIMAVVQLFILGGERRIGLFLQMTAFAAGYILLSGGLAVVCLLFGFRLFDRLTPGLDEFEEIRSGNVAVAVFMGFFVLAVCFLISAGVQGLVRALVPFPRVGSLPVG